MNRSASANFRRLPLQIAMGIALAALGTAQAATLTWRGSLADLNWSAIGQSPSSLLPHPLSNWIQTDEFAATPANGDSLVFQGPLGLLNHNDYEALSVNEMSFAAGAGAFVLGGNTLGSAGNITNRSGNLQTLNLGLRLEAAQLWDGGSAGLLMTGPLDGLDSRALTLINKVTLDRSADHFNVGGQTSTTLVLASGSRLLNEYGSIGAAAGSQGTVFVQDAGSGWRSSLWLTVGDAGLGSLQVLNGATVDSQDAYLGKQVGAMGAVLVRGSGSTWTVTGDISVGNFGYGQLDLDGGGIVNSRSGFIGRESGGDGLVTLGGASRWNNEGSMSVGESGRGRLQILSGAAINNDDGSIGEFAGSDGEVTVSGAGSEWRNRQSLWIGSNGRAMLNIQDGGFVSGGALGTTIGASGEINLSGGVFSFAALTLNGGTLSGSSEWVNSGLLSGYGRLSGSGGFSNQGTLRQADGKLILSNSGANINTGTWELASEQSLSLEGADLDNRGTLSLNGGLVVGDGLLLNGTKGTISGNGSIASAFANRGRLEVGGGETHIERTFVNRGQILLGVDSALLSGGQIGNHGLIQGQGTVNNDISNIDPIAVIEARGGKLTLAGRIVSPNGGLLLAGAGAELLVEQGLSSNAGRIQLAGGSFDNQGHDLLNAAGASISGFGALHAGRLSNQGQIMLSGGNTSFYAALELQSGAELSVSADAVANFSGAVLLQAGAKVVGAGRLSFEGGLDLGNSPGYAAIENPVTFTDSNNYAADIGGISACTADSCAPGAPLLDSSFDQLSVGGNLEFGGKLTLKSWNGFVAQAGQSFDLFDWGSGSGSFESIDASGFMLAAGTQLDYSQLYSSGTISVTAVPEPGSFALMLAGLLGLGAIAKRRRAA
ncbi:PEP-CTERM sorting domain-containing protein [Roseateles sp.]|uniref:PEP-CTERM sorting domain-containing protein n=1 Tax=Roseateles sp. TaxID=1971397 RepID=UPI00286D6900|nr:PEP-CTERM sorting domain-containing protein [Roseateles sp.]